MEQTYLVRRDDKRVVLDGDACTNYVDSIPFDLDFTSSREWNSEHDMEEFHGIFDFSLALFMLSISYLLLRS